MGAHRLETVRRRRRWLQPVPLIAVLIGLAASIGGFVVSRGSVGHNNDLLLRQDTAQGAELVASAANGLNGPFVTLGQAITPTGLNVPAFAGEAKAIDSASHGAVVVLQRAGDHYRVLASDGTVQRQFGGALDAQISTALATTPTQHIIGVFVKGGLRTLELIFGSPDVPVGYVVYSETPIGAANAVTNLGNSLFSGVVGDVYVGSVSPANLALRTSVSSGNGEHVGVVIDNAASVDDISTPTDRIDQIRAPYHLIVVLAAKGDLSGRSAALFPWLILIIGSVGAIAAAWLMALALFRRDHALMLVEDLKVQNTKLDEALTRQAEAEQVLRQAQRMEVVGRLAGGIAHDFNNLLQQILTYSGFVKDGLPENDESRADLDVVQQAAHRGAELTRQLLVFGRRDVAEVTVLDLGEVVRDNERLLRHTMGEDIDLTCRTPLLPCYVRVDRGELEQALINLATNARDAMPLGGPVTFEVQEIPGDPHQPAPTGLACISVTDHGHGMEPEVISKAFEPFFTTKETGRGTGLGLAIVYGIVNRCGGRASISSKPGVGTTVSLTFPMTDDRPSAVLDELTPAPHRDGRERVLLVEDEEGVRRSTARVLEKAGFQVSSVENAVEALARFASEPVDLVVTDVVMPGGMSGIDLAVSLRAQRPTLPIVFMSAYSSENIAERGGLLPSTRLVHKPFEPSELIAAISDSLSEESRVPA